MIQTLQKDFYLPLLEAGGYGLVLKSYYSPDSNTQNVDNAAKADEACAPDIGESLG